MSTNWHSVLNKYLAEFETQTVVTLEQINELVNAPGPFDSIKEHFRNAVKNRLNQALEFFDIQHMISEKKTPVQETVQNIVDLDASSEKSDVENLMKVEVSSDDDSSDHTLVYNANSCEAEALRSYSRVNSLDQSIDQRSTCSPSNSNMPDFLPLNADQIKTEYEEFECDEQTFSETYSDDYATSPMVKLENISTDSDSSEIVVDTSDSVVSSNSKLIMSTTTCPSPTSSSNIGFSDLTSNSKKTHKAHSLQCDRRPLKRLHSVDVPHQQSKKPKHNQVSTHNVAVGAPNGRKIMFACFHCNKHMNNKPFTLCNEFEDVENHWKEQHQTLPFQFYACGVGACYHCDYIDSYQKLQLHHNYKHPTECLVVVDQQNKSKCGLCHKILASSDMKSHFKTEHHQNFSFGINSPICFTQDEIEYLSTLNSAPSEIKSFMCGNCGAAENMAKMSFQQHIEGDEFKFRCTESSCNTWFKNIKELIEHEATEHALSLNKIKYVNDFNNRLKRHYLRTQIVFGNGLVLFKHNVLNTIFDDRGNFWKFKQEFAIKKINESSHEEPIFDMKNIDRKYELRKQREFSRNLCVTGFPKLNEDNLPQIFIYLCRLFDMNIGEDDIESYFQRQGHDIIIKLRQRSIKGEIQKRWKKAQMGKFAKKFPDLLNHFNISTKRQIFINICSDLTPFYKRLWALAEEARNAGKVSAYFISDDGLIVVVNRKRQIIWSPQDLERIGSNE